MNRIEREWQRSDVDMTFSLVSKFPEARKQEVEERAVEMLHSQGKMLHGWDYGRDENGIPYAMKKKEPQFREDLYGADLAAIYAALMHLSIIGYVDACADVARRRVCPIYCSTKHRLKDHEDKEAWDILIEAVALLVEKVIGLHIPPVSFTVFLVKHGFMEKWCPRSLPYCRLLVVNRRNKLSKVLSQVQGARVIDVTARGEEPWVRFSPLFPHGGIPIPGAMHLTNEGSSDFVGGGIETSFSHVV